MQLIVTMLSGFMQYPRATFYSLFHCWRRLRGGMGNWVPNTQIGREIKSEAQAYCINADPIYRLGQVRLGFMVIEDNLKLIKDKMKIY
jgi:hypothetical protein